MSIKQYEIGPLATNCYLFIDDNTNCAVVVDPAFESEKLLKDIQEVDLKYILLTHAHADHIMGVHKIKELTGAKIVAHENEQTRLKSKEANLYSALGCYLSDYVGHDIDIKVFDGDVLEFGEKTITVLHTPGHTDGSVCYVCADIIFCGDTVFYNSYGRTDFESGNFSQIIDSFYKLSQLEGDYALYSGHGEPTTLDRERQFNPLARFI